MLGYRERVIVGHPLSQLLLDARLVKQGVVKGFEATAIVNDG